MIFNLLNLYKFDFSSVYIEYTADNKVKQQSKNNSFLDTIHNNTDPIKSPKITLGIIYCYNIFHFCWLLKYTPSDFYNIFAFFSKGRKFQKKAISQSVLGI